MQNIKELLDRKYRQFNNENFIENDPISVPYRFNRLQDKEIAGFFAAILSWGLRKTIIKKSLELMERMDYSPYDFIKGHSEEDLKNLVGFKHRTFNELDLLYCVDFLKKQYQNSQSLEDGFVPDENDKTVESGLIRFRTIFEDSQHCPKRSLKHISSPKSGSACKRLNMYLRWMVREEGVDFGVWKKVGIKRLICPLDIHVVKIATQLGLLKHEKGWAAAVKLTESLRQFDPDDPVKYDFALFGMGVFG